jgi:hypothetical protein
MSAFGGKADIARTYPMSAFDPISIMLSDAASTHCEPVVMHEPVV